MFTNFYNALITVLYPLAIKPLIINKRKKNGKEDLARFNERMGIASQPRPQGRLIWLHGASVGESVSMLPLIHKLLELAPDINVMVTTGTITSAEVMTKRLPQRAFHQYFPIDTPKFAQNFIKHWQPNLVLWFESELWPGMLSTIKKAQIPLVLVNGRISDHSFKNWKKFSFISKELLSCFNLCLGQSELDAKRLKELGAKDALCLGNLKFAGLPLPIDEKKEQEIASQIGSRPVWAVSSTHEDEEYQIGCFLKELEKEVPNLLTIIAPRHPKRGEEIKARLQNECHLDTALRSAGEPITPETEVYIADTIGELGLWYKLCPIVFIGGSLIPHGGQNFMEPARMQDAVLVGPHMHNFKEAMAHALQAQGVIQVKDAQELHTEVAKLLSDKQYLAQKAQLAYDWAMSEAKVLDGIVNSIKGYLNQ